MSITTFDSGRMILAKLQRRTEMLENRVQFAERRLSSAERGKRTLDELLPSIGELNMRLRRVEEKLGLVTSSAVSDRAGDPQRSTDEGKRAAREAHDAAATIGDINRRNKELWATKPGA